MVYVKTKNVILHFDTPVERGDFQKIHCTTDYAYMVQVPETMDLTEAAKQFKAKCARLPEACDLTQQQNEND